MPIFEPPSPLTGGDNEVWIVACGGEEWGGAYVWVSNDGTTYANIGTIKAGAVMGTLTSPLANYFGGNPDSADTLAVDLTESRGELLSVSVPSAAQGISLCLVDNELLSFATAELSALNKYNLTNLYRGIFDTNSAAHLSGGSFAYLGIINNPSVFKYSYQPSFIGRTIFFKLQSFNLFGLAVQDLSECAAYSFNLTGIGSGGIITFLLAGINQDWGIVGTTVIANADLGSVGDALGPDIDLMGNQVVASLAAATNQDWGLVNAAIAGQADLGGLADTLAGDIDLGAIP